MGEASYAPALMQLESALQAAVAQARDAGVPLFRVIEALEEILVEQENADG